VPTDNWLLIGARGCGKSTVGRRLADASGRPFVDLDDLVILRLGAPSAAAAWSLHGEPGWRGAESEQLHVVLRESGRIIALGGGTPMIESAHRAIERDRHAGRARVIYLRCAVGTLRERLRREPGDRPSLTGADPIEEVGTVLAGRSARYEAVADIICDADGEVDAVVESVIEALVRARPDRS
jgi:shikimate kinase